MRKFKHQKYQYTNPYGNQQHSWDIVGPQGAIQFHATAIKLKNISRDWSCGLEIHDARPLSDQAPDHLACPLTGGRCHHDGTTTYAEEHLWPQINLYMQAGEHEKVFRILEQEYSERFESKPVKEISDEPNANS